MPTSNWKFNFTGNFNNWQFKWGRPAHTPAHTPSHAPVPGYGGQNRLPPGNTTQQTLQNAFLAGLAINKPQAAAQAQGATPRGGSISSNEQTRTLLEVQLNKWGKHKDLNIGLTNEDMRFPAHELRKKVTAGKPMYVQDNRTHPPLYWKISKISRRYDVKLSNLSEYNNKYRQDTKRTCSISNNTQQPNLIEVSVNQKSETASMINYAGGANDPWTYTHQNPLVQQLQNAIAAEQAEMETAKAERAKNLLNRPTGTYFPPRQGMMILSVRRGPIDTNNNIEHIEIESIIKKPNNSKTVTLKDGTVFTGDDQSTFKEIYDNIVRYEQDRNHLQAQLNTGSTEEEHYHDVNEGENLEIVRKRPAQALRETVTPGKTMYVQDKRTSPPLFWKIDLDSKNKYTVKVSNQQQYQQNQDSNCMISNNTNNPDLIEVTSNQSPRSGSVRRAADEVNQKQQEQQEQQEQRLQRLQRLRQQRLQQQAQNAIETNTTELQKCDRGRAEQTLKAQKPGTFILRKNSAGTKHVLSFTLETNNVQHCEHENKQVLEFLSSEIKDIMEQESITNKMKAIKNIFDRIDNLPEGYQTEKMVTMIKAIATNPLTPITGTEEEAHAVLTNNPPGTFILWEYRDSGWTKLSYVATDGEPTTEFTSFEDVQSAQLAAIEIKLAAIKQDPYRVQENCNRTMAVQILNSQTANNGDFLIRESSTKQGQLTVSMKIGNTTVHTQITEETQVAVIKAFLNVANVANDRTAEDRAAAIAKAQEILGTMISPSQQEEKTALQKEIEKAARQQQLQKSQASSPGFGLQRGPTVRAKMELLAMSNEKAHTRTLIRRRGIAIQKAMNIAPILRTRKTNEVLKAEKDQPVDPTIQELTDNYIKHLFKPGFLQKRTLTDQQVDENNAAIASGEELPFPAFGYVSDLDGSILPHIWKLTSYLASNQNILDEAIDKAFDKEVQKALRISVKKYHGVFGISSRSPVAAVKKVDSELVSRYGFSPASFHVGREENTGSATTTTKAKLAAEKLSRLNFTIHVENIVVQEDDNKGINDDGTANLDTLLRVNDANVSRHGVWHGGESNVVSTPFVSHNTQVSDPRYNTGLENGGVFTREACGLTREAINDLLNRQ